MKFLIVLAAILFTVGCATQRLRGGVQSGTASFYARSLQGFRTASGEPYNQKLFTAAHRTLPFGSRVEVTNRQNQKKVEVRINDRGPFVSGRVIDLSYAAAGALGLLQSGVADVDLKVLSVGAGQSIGP